MTGHAAIRRRIESRRRDLLRTLRGEIDAGVPFVAIVKAPPGSGKTTLLLELAVHAARKGQRVAVAAQTNPQVDDICRRLAEEYPRARVFRFAASHMRESDLGPRVQWIWQTGALPSGPSVVVATSAKWSMVNLPYSFDLLFVDEAWQMSWADFMLLGRVSDRFILIGDPGQIPPVVSIPVERWETSPRAPHQAAPELLLEDGGVSVVEGGLPACRRLPFDAVDLVRPFYDFEFDAWAAPGERAFALSGTRRREKLDAALDLLRDGSGVAVTLPTPTHGPPLESDLEIAALASRVATRLLDRKASVIDDYGAAAAALTPGRIGIAATHRSMNAAILEALPSRLRAHVRVDTPERWQGLQCSLMIVVHPLSGVTRPSAFDLETGRLCVMASRHRVGLVVVSRNHVAATLEEHIPYAEQAVGRPDVTGRGHQQHTDFLNALDRADRVVAL